MTLKSEEIRELKEQLKEQVKSLPPDKKREAEKQIDEMSSKAVETMLEQQKGRQQVFRMIANKEIESAIVQENEETIAVLEINPLSRGHALVIPKKAVKKKSEMPKEVLNFAEKIVKKLELTLRPKKVNMVIGEKMGEAVIDLIPVYDKEIDEESERKQASKEELEELRKEISKEVVQIKKEPEKIKVEKAERESVKLKRRIP